MRANTQAAGSMSEFSDLATPLVEMAGVALSFGGGYFIRRFTLAAREGEERGANSVRLKNIEERMTALELRKDRMDERLDRVPLREEMEAGFSRLERQLAVYFQKNG